MTARPLLVAIARALREEKLEAVLIGNAAAALHGAPVTTIDFDLFYRKTSTNDRKVQAVAKLLNASLSQPYYPSSGLLRVVREDDLMQLDFMSAIHGAHSYNGLRKRAVVLEIGGERLLVASLADIIQSKKAAGRPRDHADLTVLEETLREKSRAEGRDSGSVEEGE